MSSFTSSDKPVAAAAAGAFALAVAYFSYASAKSAATAAKASSSSSAAGVASPLSTASPVGGARKGPSGNFHADPASLGACAANNPSGFIVSNSEDDYSPSILDNTGETVASFAPEPFPDADVAAFFAAFGIPLVGKKEEDADKKSAAGNDDTSANAASSSTVSSSSFVTVGRTSEDVMAQCGALMASDVAFDGLKADAATDVVERAANLLAFVEWKNNQQLEQQRSKSDEATMITSPREQAAATSGDAVTAPMVSSSPSGTTPTPAAAVAGPSQEQLAALSTLLDARVDTIEKWREHEAPIIRSVVRMLRDIREELANIDHYKADDTSEGSSAAQKTAAGDKTDKQQTAVVADGEASKDADARAPDVSPPSVVAADAGVAAAAGEAEGEGEEQLVKRRNSIHPELVARTAVDIRERIRRLRGILEKLHTPLRELGPIGDLCNQLEAIASVLAGSD